jgi:hypothetical protein
VRSRCRITDVCISAWQLTTGWRGLIEIISRRPDSPSAKFPPPADTSSIVVRLHGNKKPSIIQIFARFDAAASFFVPNHKRQQRGGYPSPLPLRVRGTGSSYMHECCSSFLSTPTSLWARWLVGGSALTFHYCSATAAFPATNSCNKIYYTSCRYPQLYRCQDELVARSCM